MVNRTSDSRKTELGSFNINVFPYSSSFGFDSFGIHVNCHLAHLRKIDDDAILDRRSSRSAVTSSCNEGVNVCFMRVCYMGILTSDCERDAVLAYLS